MEINNRSNKIIRVTTVPSSLRTLLKGQLRFMNQYYEVIGVSSDEPAMQDVINNEGIRTHNINMTRSITPVKDLIATYKLYKFFKKEQPFIVHTHTPKAGTLGMLAAKWAGIPNKLHTVAGMPLLEATGFKRKLLNAVEKFTYKNADLVLPNSFGMKKIILDEGFTSEEKLRVIGNGSSNGIDTEQFSPDTVNESTKIDLKNELQIKDDDLVFVFVGRMVSDKGVNELVSAFDKLSANRTTIKLILVGPHENDLDPLSPETEEIIERNDHIKLVGMQMDIRPYLAISNILVHPSYREGFPNVVLQAGAMGLGCIVSDINGCNEIITDGVNGLIIPPKDATALKNAMSSIIEKPEMINSLAETARENIISNYQREYIWRELLNLYRNLEG